MQVKMTLNSEKIERDDLFTVEVFLDDLQLTDLLVFKHMISIELDRRVTIMDRR